MWPMTSDTFNVAEMKHKIASIFRDPPQNISNFISSTGKIMINKENTIYLLVSAGHL